MRTRLRPARKEHQRHPLHSRLWTESEKLNTHKVTVSPFQDDTWLRQLFAPSFIDWLSKRSAG